MKISVIIEKVHGALAQLGARHTGSVEVTGSSPVCSRRYDGRPERMLWPFWIRKSCGYPAVSTRLRGRGASGLMDKFY